MERPDPCMTLNEFIKLQRGLLESTARTLMRQAVMAVKHCFKYEIFHTDLHAGNFLVDKNNMLLKLIDFGCCDRLRDTAYAYEEYLGAPAYRPPEVRNRDRYHAMSSSVWSLGTLLYYMVNGNLPFPKYGPVTEGMINHENDYLTKRKKQQNLLKDIGEEDKEPLCSLLREEQSGTFHTLPRAETGESGEGQ
nr:serine/threonine-protein kinase pim-3-like [Misgurnus anguillicaudatus]